MPRYRDLDSPGGTPELLAMLITDQRRGKSRNSAFIRVLCARLERISATNGQRHRSAPERL